MSLEQLAALLGWMTVINMVIMVLSAILLAGLKGILGRYHSKLFAVSAEEVAAASCNYLGRFKVLIIVFNLTPYIALRLIA
jgi:hypothetical protein